MMPDAPNLGPRPDAAGRSKGLDLRPWYRRKLVIIPLVLLILIGAAVGGAVVYINERFDTINALSTPPPVVTGDQLGGNEGVVIDTGPAQEAVRRAQVGGATSTATVPSDPTAGASGIDFRTLSRNDGVVMAVQPLNQGALSEATPQALPAEAGSATPVTIQLPPSDTSGSINVLLMGVDARPGEAIDIGVRPDTLVVLNLDPQTGSCRMLAIPRDSRVELPGYGASKVNHALAVGGVPYQMLVTQNLLGIPFDHYGLIDFAGVEDLVEALGGITVVNEREFSHGGHTFAKGELRLKGEETLAYVRFRGDEEGDFGRQERQQLVVRSMLSAGADLDVVTAIPKLLNAVEDHIRTDADPTTLIDLGREFHSSCTAETLDAKRINGEVRTLHDVLLDEPLSFVVLTEAEVAAKVNWLLTGEEPPTPTPNATPVPSSQPRT
jgi:LCP family protein required for cell wall assembly